MAEQTHNDTVMTTNLSTLTEKCLKGGHRCEGVCALTHVQWRRRVACVRACVRPLDSKGSGPARTSRRSRVGLLLATH